MAEQISGDIGEEAGASQEGSSGGKKSMIIGVAAGVMVASVVLVLGAVIVIGVVAAIAIPNFVQMGLKAKRSEVQTYMMGIKTAELAYEAAFDDFVEVKTPQPDDSPGKAQRPWSHSSAFDTLGWAPDGPVRGSYWVEKSGRSDFIVHGISDVDGDGIQAHFTATKSINPTMITGPDTY